MKRIGITQRVEALPGRDERRDCLDQAWWDRLPPVGLLPIALPNRTDLALRIVREMGLEGLLISGGNDLEGLPGATAVAPERDACEAALLDHFAAHDLPVLGVCRGLQMMTMHYGGRLRRVSDHVRVMHALTTTAAAADTPLHDGLKVNSFHGWGAMPEDLGAALLPLATCEDGTVEAVRHCALPQWAVMWHPERGAASDVDTAFLRVIFGLRGDTT